MIHFPSGEKWGGGFEWAVAVVFHVDEFFGDEGIAGWLEEIE